MPLWKLPYAPQLRFKYNISYSAPVALYCPRLLPAAQNQRQSAYFIRVAKDSEQLRQRQQTGAAEVEEEVHRDGGRERATLLREVRRVAFGPFRNSENPLKLVRENLGLLRPDFSRSPCMYPQLESSAFRVVSVSKYAG